MNGFLFLASQLDRLGFVYDSGTNQFDWNEVLYLLYGPAEDLIRSYLRLKLLPGRTNEFLSQQLVDWNLHY